MLVAAGGVFGVRALQGDSGDPQDPVEQLFTALDHEDMIGVLEALTPAERDILVGRSQRLAGELRRIGVADQNLDLGHLAGVDLQVDGLQLETTKVTDDLAEVRVVAGQLASSVAVDQLPLGQDLRRLADEGEAEKAAEPQTEDFADHDLRFMVLRRGGSWGLSLGYTIAEAARRDAGLDRPDFGHSAVQAQGAASPEQAVEGLLGAVDDGDIPGVIGHLDPEEMAALYDYAPLFLPGPSQSQELRTQAEQFTISDLQLHAEGSGSERRVKLTAATVTVDTGDVHAVVRVDNGCLHAESDPRDGYRARGRRRVPQRRDHGARLARVRGAVTTRRPVRHLEVERRQRDRRPRGGRSLVREPVADRARRRHRRAERRPRRCHRGDHRHRVLRIRPDVGTRLGDLVGV